MDPVLVSPLRGQTELAWTALPPASRGFGQGSRSQSALSASTDGLLQVAGAAADACSPQGLRGCRTAGVRGQPQVVHDRDEVLLLDFILFRLPLVRDGLVAERARLAEQGDVVAAVSGARVRPRQSQQVAVALVALQAPHLVNVVVLRRRPSLPGLEVLAGVVEPRELRRLRPSTA